ncbi:MAG: serine--tRNA ligase [Candidatus Chaera renei]|uniref:Serine--tRNA ligase n=1 Tax=Candidatus Chaera renei TaxID=2506947 RepID=A0A4V1J7P0_9BACT|nr:MAG: serine--tRNA ligase [Candidatus Chaera renei]
MLDINFIRQNADRVAEAAAQKGYAVDIDRLLGLDKQRRDLIGQIEALRHQRNQLAESGVKGAKPNEEQVNRGRQLKTQLSELEDRLQSSEHEYLNLLKAVPNLPTDDVPVGASEDDNVVSKTVGEPAKFDFTPKNHWEIGEQRGWIDKARAAKVAGSRFAYLKGDLVLLQWALMQFGLSVLTDEAALQSIIAANDLKLSSKPFLPVLPPAVARTEVYEATGRLNGSEMTYKLEDEDLWLNASAEHTLCPMHSDEIIDEADLPLRYVGYTTAFRREAGTYGKDMEGILRLHQFDKLEMESFTAPENSYQEHLLMIAIQEHLMSRLGLPYQVILKCTADIGKPNARGVDINVWLPGQNRYRETHTADLITDYQARRLNTRLRRAGGGLELAHTNDATAFSQRPLIAILENYQTADGKVTVPEVLRPFMGGREVI